MCALILVLRGCLPVGGGLTQRGTVTIGGSGLSPRLVVPGAFRCLRRSCCLTALRNQGFWSTAAAALGEQDNLQLLGLGSSSSSSQSLPVFMLRWVVFHAAAVAGDCSYVLMLMCALQLWKSVAA